MIEKPGWLIGRDYVVYVTIALILDLALAVIGVVFIVGCFSLLIGALEVNLTSWCKSEIV